MIVSLVSSDGKLYQVDEAVARRSGVIYTVLEDIGNQKPIPLLNVPSHVLKQVIEYCEHHRSDPLPQDAEWSSPARVELVRRKAVISDWDKKFINCDQTLLFEIIQAASYLDIKPLLDLGCKTVANMMTGKSVEDIRALFHIENDFTPEEETAIQVERSEFESLYNIMIKSMAGVNAPVTSLPVPGKARRRLRASH